jgi:hypothetical protein
MASRGDYLKIYDVVIDTGGQIPVFYRDLIELLIHYCHITSPLNGSNLTSTSRNQIFFSSGETINILAP